MRIGIDCKTILHEEFGELAGVGHYTYFLVRKIIERDAKNTYILFFHNKNIKIKEFEFPHVKMVYIPFSRFKKYLPFVFSHIIVPFILCLYKLDLYHNPANTMPIFYCKKSVITIHDLAIYRNKKWFPKRQWFSKYILVPLSIRRAKHIIAVSENTRNDIINIFHVDPKKISVVYEGVEFYDHVLQKEVDVKKLNVPEKYFLYVGTLEPRKNIVRTIQAFAKFLENSPDKKIRLVLAGKKGWYYESIFEKIKELGLEANVQYLGYVKTSEKVYLMKNAYAFLFVTLYEGFGLPVLEAMYFGTPVITSNVASIPEIIIDNAIMVDPYSVDEISAGMKEICEDEACRAMLKSKGKELSQAFTWDQTAKETLLVYESL